VWRAYWKTDSVAVFPALSQKIQSDRALLGDLGVTLEWDEVGRCGDDAGVGQGNDVEGTASGGGVEPQSVCEGDSTWQESDAGGREPFGAPSCVAQVGYSDPSSFKGLIREILFEKSPKNNTNSVWIKRSRMVPI